MSFFEKTYALPFPRGVVFDAWVSEETVIAPAAGMHVDPQVGGVYRLEMPDGSQMNGAFSEFTAGSSLRYSWQWDGSPESTQVAVVFADAPNGSTVAVNHSGFDSAESLSNHAQGWDGYISGFAAHLHSQNVRQATARDIEAMHRVRTSVRENTLVDYSVLTPEAYRSHLERLGRGWVYEHQGRVVGLAIANRVEASIWALFVEPEFEKRGIGRALHDTMLTWLTEEGVSQVTLGTDPETRAAGFYEAAGWIFEGVDDEGEAVFRKSLEAGPAPGSQVSRIAQGTFGRIRNTFSTFEMHTGETDEGEPQLVIPRQAGLLFEVSLYLSDDVLSLCAGEHFKGDWFPCLDPDVVSAFEEAVSGVLVGDFRVVEHHRGSRFRKAILERPTADGWEPVYRHYGGLTWPWLEDRTNVLVNRNPGDTSL